MLIISASISYDTWYEAGYFEWIRGIGAVLFILGILMLLIGIYFHQRESKEEVKRKQRKQPKVLGVNPALRLSAQQLAISNQTSSSNTLHPVPPPIATGSFDNVAYSTGHSRQSSDSIPERSLSRSVTIEEKPSGPRPILRYSISDSQK